jgi:ABC-2 type transport system ATP-binding protein
MELHGALYRVPRKVRRERSEMLLKAFGLWERKDGVVMQFRFF